MSSTPARNSRSRSHLLRTLALSLGAIAIVGVTDIAPANAWYDAYGYWHPNHSYRHHYWRSAERHRWCVSGTRTPAAIARTGTTDLSA